jgi:RHS repeat-associated protein
MVDYTYDDNGNLKTAGNRTFTYDLANRLATTTAGGTTFKYSYDADGKRVQASSGNQAANKTNYLWDPNAPLPVLVREADGRDNLLRRYVYGADLVSMTTGAGTFYYHHDGLGTVANLTSATGTPQWSYTYEPFGSMRTEVRNDPSAPTNLMRFTGEYFDMVSGLYHLRARQYDPATGRFLQVDPVAQSIFDPRVTAYTYVNNLPTVWTDPSGRCFLVCLGAAVGAVVSGVSYGLRVAFDEEVAWSWKGFVVNVGAGAASGAVAGATLGLGLFVSAGASAAANVAANQIGAYVCGAGLVPFPDAEALGWSIPGTLAQSVVSTRLGPVAQVVSGVGVSDAFGGYNNTITGPSCGESGK